MKFKREFYTVEDSTGKLILIRDEIGSYIFMLKEVIERLELQDQIVMDSDRRHLVGVCVDWHLPTPKIVPVSVEVEIVVKESA
ncbi:hypothetical protein EVB32_128 [Rhizobium phage RHph_TM39]|uniref:Uncharacterized protein n=2 Tax=Cuauhnahuacvirus TaxID=3044696 RepID=A0A7S5R7S4_9CAUD|nr:hypothetical protein PQC16_gp128 [Rhizobium phage RHph_TM30]YP_010671278.1 hypothetical protein PQC17_gp129 [Rhizobium phage RHph_Y65]QIG71599.1 hypothetical protein EVB94_128 [Rhizobium phage RHph_TM40]QIG71962.1 hypothetical protein EVB95_128 [Rhizobium phage RHph_TM2_3B]QIG72324.1 hypothetical protein EVB96_128 [Rhizobium phage RHph_TM3_3_6]QIG77116.1 hypothetical protein EVB32_128 [Rhizobium phage RHph_TM39]QIG77452.1 hypothetical protein EVB61_124 [Rhizobium phage RHph_TM21B]QIG77714